MGGLATFLKVPASLIRLGCNMILNSFNYILFGYLTNLEVNKGNC